MKYVMIQYLIDNLCNNHTLISNREKMRMRKKETRKKCFTYYWRQWMQNMKKKTNSTYNELVGVYTYTYMLAPRREHFIFFFYKCFNNVYYSNEQRVISIQFVFENEIFIHINSEYFTKIPRMNTTIWYLCVFVYNFNRFIVTVMFMFE